LTASALHFRILARTHDEDYAEVDLRAIGADVLRRRVQTLQAKPDEIRVRCIANAA
jgi:hypothetical protein